MFVCLSVSKIPQEQLKVFKHNFQKPVIGCKSTTVESNLIQDGRHSQIRNPTRMDQPKLTNLKVSVDVDKNHLLHTLQALHTARV